MEVKVLPRWFAWSPGAHTLVAGLAGLLAVGLSWAMIPTRSIPWLSLFIRDIAMVCLLGIVWPLGYVARHGERYEEFGLSSRKWQAYLPINAVLAALLVWAFTQDTPVSQWGALDRRTVFTALVIMYAGVFEVVFFFSFLRTLFERAFGIVAGVVLSAAFYSLHHIGFQPEFGKLFLVGLMYATVFRWGNSALLIYPFFWGVGALWDVLVQSQVVRQIPYPEIRAAYLSVAMVAIAIWQWRQRLNRT